MAVLACALAAFLAANKADAQMVTATLLGTVTDSSGAIIQDAAIVITETSTGVQRKTQSNSDGFYTQPYLPPGAYKVEIEVNGFKKFSRDNIELRVNSSVRVDASLEPGATTETVNVTAESPLLQTDRSDVNRTVSTQQVRELPIANRSFQALVGLLPGVTPPVANFTALEDPQGTNFYQANGQGNSANNVQVDGVDNNNPTLGLTIYIPPAEAVQEVNVSTSNYSAELGRAGGAVMNVVTRGGTNQYHGSLFHFHRNRDLRARNFFNFVPQPKPAFIRNQFGGTFGGPIVKNKTFFFGSYQGTLERRANTQLNTVPSAAWREGNFSGTPGLQLYDPFTGNADGTGRTPFVNNIIPRDRFSPITSRLLPFIPATTSAELANNLVGNVPFRYDGHNYDGRIDHSFNERNNIFVKYNYSPYKVAQDALLGFTVGDGVASKVRTHTVAINYNRQWSPTLIMEARAGYNRYFADVNGNNIDDPLGSQLGIANPNPDDISARGMARFNVSGMPGMGPQVVYPLVNADNLFNVINNWTKIRGKHTIKWGADLRRIRADRFQPQGLGFGPRGRFDYNPGTTAIPGQALGPFGTLGNSFAAFLLGAPDLTYRTFQTVTPTNRVTQAFFFAHDTWQVSNKLTLDLGLRYEAHSTVKPRYAGGASNYQPDNNTLIVAGIGDVDLSTNVDFDALQFAPRLGFAYRASNRTVIRGGYGLSYYTGRFGFTGGTLSTQFPVIYNIQEGVAGNFRVEGRQDSLPVIPLIPIPSSGIISPAPNQGFFVVPKNNPIPMVHSYNLTVQRELARGLVADVGYVGTLGRRIPGQRNLNHSFPGLGAAGLVFNQRFGRTAEIQERANAYNNNYNALQASLQKRYDAGLSFGVSYTWSRAMGVGDDQPGFTIPSAVRERHYGPAGFDRTHMLVVNHLWDLPFGKGKKWANSGAAAWLVGNWQLNGVLRMVTGAPFSIVADAGPCNCPGNGNFANVVKTGEVEKLGGAGPGQRFFDTTHFAAPAAGTFGNAGRNIVRGPGFVNYDFSVFRNFILREGWRLEFRSEFYNLTNTPRFANPVGNVNAGNFGQITSTLQGVGEREVQFALRLLF
ncbi:MAG: carboxypeptidase regulatory-like domain-containing protein [Bryobacteraceae bacterium]|nr:carboxypeptidase regulatory-like domain-containing protein [Bryobacteraceae bacterium]